MQTARQLHLPCFHPSLYSWAYSSSFPQVVANLVAMVLLEIGCSTIVSKIAGAFQLVATCLVTASAGKDLLEESRKKLAIDFIFAGPYVGQEGEEAQAAHAVHTHNWSIASSWGFWRRAMIWAKACLVVSSAPSCRPTEERSLEVSAGRWAFWSFSEAAKLGGWPGQGS